MRRALTLAIDRWGSAPELSKIAIVKTVGGVIFPGSPLAATKEELQKIAGYWPDIEKSRAEAKRLLKEAGAEKLSFELLNRDVDQPYKYYGIWVVDQWSKIGVKVTQRVVPTGPWFQAHAQRQFRRDAPRQLPERRQSAADVGKYLPHSCRSRTTAISTTRRSRAVQPDAARARQDEAARLMLLEFEKQVLDDQAHAIYLLWWQRIVPYRSYVKGWKISPSHYVNQDLGDGLARQVGRSSKGRRDR